MSKSTAQRPAWLVDDLGAKGADFIDITTLRRTTVTAHQPPTSSLSDRHESTRPRRRRLSRRRPDSEPAGPHPNVQVRAAALNPIDLSVASGAFPGWPARPGTGLGVEGVGQTGDGTPVYFAWADPPYGAIAEAAPDDDVAGRHAAAGGLHLDSLAGRHDGGAVVAGHSRGLLGSVAKQFVRPGLPIRKNPQVDPYRRSG